MAKFHVLNTAGKSTTKSQKEKQIILFSYASNDVLLFPASETLPELHLFFNSSARPKTSMQASVRTDIADTALGQIWVAKRLAYVQLLWAS